MTTLQQAEAAEHAMSQELDRVVVKSVIYTSGERDPRVPAPRPPDNGKLYLMADDPRLPKMPDKPTLFDFFRYRFGPSAHLLQSARLAQKNGVSEKIVLACLLHDIAIAGFIRSDHGYWSAQLLEPYVDPEVSWAIRYHQALRFFPDEANGYRYPELYTKLFGADYVPEPYIQESYRVARDHKWYMSARLITIKTSTRSIPACRWSSRSSPTWSGGTSGSRWKGSASTRARRRTCGGPSTGRRGTCSRLRSASCK
jgi:HD domain